MISNNTSLSSGNIHPKLRSVSRQLLIALLLAFGSVSAWSDETASAAPQPEAPKPPAYRELTETTEKVATAYAEHYFNRE